MSADPYELQRFIDAQRDSYADAERELAAGRKQSHWMWYIFPQIEGLGSSAMARKYAIGSLAEAQAYLAHPVLGPRLKHCTRLVIEVRDASIEEIFGYPDHLKFHSSMTLFAHASPQEPTFPAAMQKYFHAQPDPATQQRLRAA